MSIRTFHYKNKSPMPLFNGTNVEVLA